VEVGIVMAETVVIPDEEEMVLEEERAEQGLPFEEYAKDSEKIRKHVQQLEKQYDEREKVIKRIIEYGTGIESEKALRMYPTSVLRKWDESLESFRKEQLAKH
jgi:hypothetical protein